MPAAARVSDLTAHGAPLGAGPGSPNVRIGGRSAWRALPTGPVGAALDAASAALKPLMSAASLTPASAAAQLADALAAFQQAAAADPANQAAASSTTAALSGLNAQNAALASTWASASAVPGGMAPATAAYTTGLKALIATVAGAVMSSIAGPADIHSCPVPCPAPPHGPGVVTRGSGSVRINGLPAVRQGDKVVEACGGSDAISAGCASVLIGG